MKTGLDLIDSGATGGGCLIDGKDCGGYWAKYRLPSGRTGVTQVLYDEAGEVADESIKIDGASDIDDPEYAMIRKELDAEIEMEKNL